MKKKIKKRSWILVCIAIGLVVVCLSGCGKNKKVESASVEGALAYLESNYRRDNYEVKFLKENNVEPYRELLFGIDGSYIHGDVPARTETCYLGYSIKNDLYFFVFHSTYSQRYSTTLGEELAQIKIFAKAIASAKDVFGEYLIKTNVNIYINDDRPIYNYGKLKPIYSEADIDVQKAYNRLILDTEDPFSPRIMNISKNEFGFIVFPYLNVYVDCSLGELNAKMKEAGATDKFESISKNILFITNDGVYNRPDLTPEMFNALE